MAKKVTLKCQFCLTLNRVDLERVGQGPKCRECGKPFLLDRPVKVSGEEFDRVIGDSEVPVLVDFYADWCGPCKTMAPVIDELAGEYSGEVLVAKLDTDVNPGVAQRYGIRGIPTVILFRDGEEVARETGAVPRDRLDSLLAPAK